MLMPLSVVPRILMTSEAKLPAKKQLPFLSTAADWMGGHGRETQGRQAGREAGHRGQAGKAGRQGRQATEVRQGRRAASRCHVMPHARGLDVDGR